MNECPKCKSKQVVIWFGLTNWECKDCGYRYTEKIEDVLEDWRKICEI